MRCARHRTGLRWITDRAPEGARAVALAIALCAILTAAAGAAERAPFEARAGTTIAQAAARAWAPDAVLVYLENDEEVASSPSREVTTSG